MKISELLQQRNLRLVTAKSHTLVMDITRRMARFNIGIVVVIDDQMNIVGVLSERDVLRRLGGMEEPIDLAVVGELMTESVVTISPEDSLVDAVVAMNSNRIRHLIVAEDNKAVGVLSIRDVLQAFAQQQLDNNSENYDQSSRQIVEALAAA